MSMMDMGFTGGPNMCADSQVLPSWVAGERFYNCENFSKDMRKGGFNLDRLFQSIGNLDMRRLFQ